MKSLRALLVAALCFAPLAAFAADPGEGDLCTSCISDQVRQPVLLLCNGMIAAGLINPKVKCGPIVLPGHGATRIMIRVRTWPTLCPTLAIKFEESESLSEIAPNVWHEIQTSTMGPGVGDVSQIIPDREAGPVIRATFADVTDANCTGAGITLIVRRLDAK